MRRARTKRTSAAEENCAPGKSMRHTLKLSQAAQIVTHKIDMIRLSNCLARSPGQFNNLYVIRSTSQTF
jgi:hypothetical protein